MSVIDVANLSPVTVTPGESVREAARRMVERSIGSVVVCEGTRVVGIFTERDVLRLAADGGRLEDVRVGDVMTARLVAVRPDDDVLAVAHLMGERQIRHVPVLEGENLVGVVGIRDVLGVLAELLWRSHDEEAHETVSELLSRPARA